MRNEEALPPPGGVRITVMSMSVYLSVYPLAYLENYPAKLHRNFYTHIDCGGTAICYGLPVLWLTSCFHTTGPNGVATVGHGWARTHSTSARVGREICANSRVFLGVGVGRG